MERVLLTNNEETQPVMKVRIRVLCITTEGNAASEDLLAECKC